MDYKLDDLQKLVQQLQKNPSKDLIDRIENSLRDIRGKKEIIPSKELVGILKQLGTFCSASSFGNCNNIPFLIIEIISKTKGMDKTVSTVGTVASDGQNKLRQSVNDKLSAFYILKKYGIDLWP